jgi:hypothetical protein
MSGSLKWRFTTHLGEGKYRFNPVDSLMEAKSDAWMLEWADETGDNHGEAMCRPMLCEFADLCADKASTTTDLLNADWARHWAATRGTYADRCGTTYDKPVMAALGAMRHCILTFGRDNEEEGKDWVETILRNLCARARGVL